MLIPPPTLGRIATRIARASALTAVLLLGACAGPDRSPSMIPLTPDEPPSSAPANASASADASAAAQQANTNDPAGALANAQALRAGNAKQEALAALGKVSAANPTDRRLLMERGLLTLELGEPAKAEKLLRQAHDPKAPDWRLHSALGAALASQGKQQEAQVQFAKALTLAPDQPSVLNNLALSYALDDKTAEAEQLLRKAQRSAERSPQMQENLALVLGLRGRYGEARSAATQSALPSDKFDQNVAYLRELSLARSEASAGEKATTQPTTAMEPRRKATASLPQPSYQLGGPKPPAE